jgi:hypothetical protein
LPLGYPYSYHLAFSDVLLSPFSLSKYLVKREGVLEIQPLRQNLSPLRDSRAQAFDTLRPEEALGLFVFHPSVAIP